MSRSGSTPEIVVVGAGVAGSALAIVLARAGREVVLLEKSRTHVDRVRGEFIVPWGVAEARQLGLLDLLERAGGNYTVKSVPYGEGTSPEQARATALAMDRIVPDVRGALNLGHPRLCDTLNAAAVEAGVTLLRGIERLQVTPGQPPQIAFEHDGSFKVLTPKIVIGADGRNSAVARQAGFERLSDPVHHFFTGLLVDGADAWPSDEQSMGVDGDIGFYVLPQGQGRIRLYAAHSVAQRQRFAGEGAVERFLAAFDCPSLPHGKHLAAAHPAGPCQGYPNNEVWIDVPVAPGVVLIGDAAGHSDPAGGQGISIAFRDVRLAAAALAADAAWTPDAFAGYVTERRELMRRLRFSTRLLAVFRMEFTDEARQRRVRVRARMAASPELGLPFAAFQKGPFAVPAEAFAQSTWDRILN